MLPDQERLVRQSWPILEREAAEASRQFYARLFELDPTARALFAHVDLTVQGAKFMAMLGGIVAALDRAPTLVADVAALARRHARYGVAEEHYASVGAALLWTVERVLGPACTPDVRAAWAEAYALLAAVMRRAMARELEATSRSSFAT